MTRIGLLSDTHSYLDPRVLEHFAEVDEIWHAGDIGSAMVLQHLREFKPTRAVYGNMDSGDVRYSLSEFYRFRVEEVNVLMTHIGGYPGRYDIRAKELLDRYHPDIFVCGHSHILKVVRDPKRDGMLVINPGAAGIQGFHLVRTALRFHIDDGKIHSMEVFELDR